MEHTSKEDKMLSSVIENDKDTIDNGKVLNDMINQGLGSFTPDAFFEKLVQNFKTAKQIYGDSLIQKIGGYSPGYIEKNLNISEFKEELKKQIEEKVESLKEDGYLSKEGEITDDGFKLASIVSYIEEIEHIMPKGMNGKKVNKRENIYGSKEEVMPYKKGMKYKSLSTKATIKKSLRRGHNEIKKNDLMVFEKESKGKIYIVYGIDASGSMKGEKIHMSKKAGIALSFQATQEKDFVGTIIFGKEVKQKVYPTQNFGQLLEAINRIQTGEETNFTQTIQEAIAMFPRYDVTKHLILITDAIPTVGKDPKKEALDAISIAAQHNITVSLVGINLNDEGIEFAEKMVRIGKGKLYRIRDIQNIDRIILEDYYNNK